jgi:hypothetical protein
LPASTFSRIADGAAVTATTAAAVALQAALQTAQRVAQQAAQKAAASSAVAAAARAASSAKSAAQPSAAGTTTKSHAAVVVGVSSNPRDIAKSLSAARGWTAQQWMCLDTLWQHESMYRTTARNSRSGAYGIPQALPASKMSTAGADWRTNPVTQVRWGLQYIAVRYGSPCDAWSYWRRHLSY